jgi:hypothetical protein
VLYRGREDANAGSIRDALDTHVSARDEAHECCACAPAPTSDGCASNTAPSNAPLFVDGLEVGRDCSVPRRGSWRNRGSTKPRTISHCKMLPGHLHTGIQSRVVTHVTPFATHVRGSPFTNMLCTRQPHERDTRVDFFRGLALLFIFIDHVPGNFLGWVTLRNFGFVDAAEVFVGLAGYAAFLAYSPTLETVGWRALLEKVALRIRDLYLAHVIVLAVCVASLILLALTLENPVYLKHTSVQPFIDAPSEAFVRALILMYQPGYFDILPLYVALLVWFPLLLWLVRRHVGWAAGVSVCLWMAASFWQWNLPSYTQQEGWMFNPLAWQLLFSLGVVTAYLARKKAFAYSRTLFWLASSYVVFAFLVAAPWTNLPGLSDARLLPADLLAPMSKRNLSFWRLMHIVALAYVAASLIPVAAGWLTRFWALPIIKCGCHALPVFCLGSILSIAGVVVMVEFGRGVASQIAVNVVGFAILGFTAWGLADLKRDSRIRAALIKRLGLRVSPSSVHEPPRQRYSRPSH